MCVRGFNSEAQVYPVSLAHGSCVWRGVPCLTTLLLIALHSAFFRCLPSSSLFFRCLPFLCLPARCFYTCTLLPLRSVNSRYRCSRGVSTLGQIALVLLQAWAIRKGCQCSTLSPRLTRGTLVQICSSCTCARVCIRMRVRVHCVCAYVRSCECARVHPCPCPYPCPYP